MEKPPGQRRLGSEDPSGRGEGDCYTAGEGEGVGTWHAQAGQGISGLESEEGKGEGKELPDRQEPSQLAPHKGERPTAPTPWEAGVPELQAGPTHRDSLGAGARGGVAATACSGRLGQQGTEREGICDSTKR